MSALTLGYNAELEQLGEIVERLPIGVIIFSKARLEVVFANPAAQRLLHPSTPRRGRELPEPWSTFSLRGYAQRMVETGVGLKEEIDVADDRFYLLSGITSRGANSAVILVEDVSERERRSRAEREFIANAAHELLTPLTGIVSAAHVLQAGAKDVPEDRDNFIDHIARECDRLTRIARSLLVLARAQSGEEPPRLEIVRVCDLLDEAVEAASTVETLPVAVRCDDALTVLADADLFVQAAVNLVRNLVRHGSGGELAIEARRVGSTFVAIDFTDTGRAATHELGELRGRFRAGGGRDSGGFGLGLSIASQALQTMNGRLELDPEESVAVRIELPSGGFGDESARSDR